MESLDKTLTTAVATLSDRQDKLEEMSTSMLDLLSTQISSILLSVSNTRKSPENPSPSSALPVVTCSLCPSTFQTLATLDLHTQACHLSLQCDLCGKTLRSKPDINYHHHKYHSGELLSLENNPNELTPQQQNPPDSFQCNVCEQNYESENELTIHVIGNHTITTHPACLPCGQTFGERRDLDNHNQLVHSQPSELQASPRETQAPSLHCNHCGKPLFSVPYLNLHMHRQHSHLSQGMREPSPHVCRSGIDCDQCAPVSESNVTMTSHLDNQHQEDSLELASMNKLQSISTFYSCAMCKYFQVMTSFINTLQWNMVSSALSPVKLVKTFSSTRLN